MQQTQIPRPSIYSTRLTKCTACDGSKKHASGSMCRVCRGTGEENRITDIDCAVGSVVIGLDLIDMDPNYRVRELSEDAVGEYADDMRTGARFPAVMVHIKEDGSLKLVGGWHRIAAAKQIGLASFPVQFAQEGDRWESVFAAIADNKRNGLRLSRADKAALLRQLLEDPEKSKLSNRKLGKLVGLKHPTVGAHRKKLQEEKEGKGTLDVTDIDCNDSNCNTSNDDTNNDEASEVVNLPPSTEEAATGDYQQRDFIGELHNTQNTKDRVNPDEVPPPPGPVTHTRHESDTATITVSIQEVTAHLDEDYTPPPIYPSWAPTSIKAECMCCDCTDHMLVAGNKRAAMYECQTCGTQLAWGSLDGLGAWSAVEPEMVDIVAIDLMFREAEGRAKVFRPGKVRSPTDNYDTPRGAALVLMAHLMQMADYHRLNLGARPCLDPCAGAGNLLWAAQRAGLHAVGADIKPRCTVDLRQPVEQVDLLDRKQRTAFATRLWTATNAEPIQITNTPYSIKHPDLGTVHTQDFWKACLNIGADLFALVRLTAMEPTDERVDLLNKSSWRLHLTRQDFTDESGQKVGDGDLTSHTWICWGPLAEQLADFFGGDIWIGKKEMRQYHDLAAQSDRDIETFFINGANIHEVA